jgi:hypothetical protein
MREETTDGELKWIMESELKTTKKEYDKATTI